MNVPLSRTSQTYWSTNKMHPNWIYRGSFFRKITCHFILIHIYYLRDFVYCYGPMWRPNNLWFTQLDYSLCTIRYVYTGWLRNWQSFQTLHSITLELEQLASSTRVTVGTRRMSEELFLTFERRVFQVELFIQTKTLSDLNIPFTSNGFVEDELFWERYWDCGSRCRF